MPCAHVVVEPVDLTIPVESAVVVFAREPESAVLESSLHKTSYGRFSLLACDPVATVVVDRNDAGCPFRALAAAVDREPPTGDGSGHLPFTGGWIGYISYEAGLSVEAVTRRGARRPTLPQLRFNLYDTLAIHDGRTGDWAMIAVAWPAGVHENRAPVKDRLTRLRRRLDQAASLDPPDLPFPLTAEPPRANMSHRAYTAKVQRAKRYIEAGDIYQVNVTQRFTGRSDVTPLTLYRRLRKASPSPYAALLSWDDYAILSSSPELFLDLQNGHVVTRPIKGTRPRGDDPGADAAYRNALINSEKDHAELTMIIDLLRNDLGRVCEFGTVRVTDAGTIETHPTVFHRVATIEGDLKPDAGWMELLKAAFPGGSVTGAPKIRAMQIIDELEPTARDVYCGSIGMIGLDGSMSLNLAIRTMIQHGETVHLYAGGAIVADSEPEAEYEETLAKAKGMMRALGCEYPAHAVPQEALAP